MGRSDKKKGACVQGNKRRARSAMKRVFTLGAGIGVLVGSAIFLNRNSLPTVFSSDPNVIRLAAQALVLQAASLVRTP